MRISQSEKQEIMVYVYAYCVAWPTTASIPNTANREDDVGQPKIEGLSRFFVYEKKSSEPLLDVVVDPPLHKKK